MRVIAGIAKGRKLVAPKGLATRPMTDQIRAAVFSSLAERVERARVLDLYSGSGAVGIEALSRGAANVVFVESDRAAVETIRRNLETTGFDRHARVVQNDVDKFLARGERDEEHFDLVLVDPPFDTGLPSRVLKSLIEQSYLSVSATIVLRLSARLELPERLEGLRVRSRRRYGDSLVLYLQKETSE